MTDRMIDRMFDVSKIVDAQEAGLRRKVAALEDEVRYLRGVYADVGKRFLKMNAENERLREILREVTPPPHFGESEQNKAWWAKARVALGETK